MKIIKIAEEIDVIFTVAISKSYFQTPQTKKNEFGDIQDIVKVKAHNRTEAALRAWAENKDRWQKDFKPNLTRFHRHVSLYVDAPNNKELQGALTRLTPIRVV